MPPRTIATLLAQGEGESVEFKSSLSDSRKIIETAAAMATRGGGTILIGVRDDRTPVGTSLGEGEVERLVQQVLANTDPRLYVSVEREEHAGKSLLRIEVPPGDGPHLAFGRAFHRVGPATVGMTRDEYERRLLDRLRESSGFERRWVEGVTVEHLDPTEVARWTTLAAQHLEGLSKGATPRAVTQRLHLSSGEAVTIAGWLLFAREPEAALPQAVIRAVATRGTHQDSRVFGGPVGRQIDEAVAFVARNLRETSSIQGARRITQPELPGEAVRELVANAVAHRDYRSTAAIQLRLDDTRLELWNPGTLPPPITPALLRQTHPSVPPNPLLARGLFLAGYIEEWGTGTLNVIQALARNGNPEPIFDVSDGAGVRVTVGLRGTATQALTPRQKKGLGMFKPGMNFTTARYAERGGVSLRTAQADLRQLEALGVVEQVGVGRATRWRVVGR